MKSTFKFFPSEWWCFLPCDFGLDFYHQLTLEFNQINNEPDMYVCIVITYSKSMDQPGKVANPPRGQLNRENEFFPVPVRA